MPGGVQLSGNKPFSSVRNEEFVSFSTDGGFLWLHDQFAVFPVVAEWSAAVDGFAELGASEDGRVDTFGDFFTFPLGEDTQQMEEHPASRRAGVNRFAQGN